MILTAPFVFIFARLGLPHPINALSSALALPDLGAPPWPGLPFVSWPRPAEGLAWAWVLLLLAWMWVVNRVLTRL